MMNNRDVNKVRGEVVTALRNIGLSYTDIGPVLNVTRQRAQQIHSKYLLSGRKVVDIEKINWIKDIKYKKYGEQNL